jgi:Transposase DDE domain
MFSSYASPQSASKGFSFVANAFLQGDGLPFAQVLPQEEIEATFAQENGAFADQEDAVYTPAVTLWAWLSQALHAGIQRSCVAAVSRITVLYIALGRKPPSPDTGAYCRARAKLPHRVLKRLVYSVADGLESRVPLDWLWLTRHVKLVDGTTLRMADTEANQRVWPQDSTQKPGVGFPILRMVVLLSLATAALCGMATAPYQGKETGEAALLRELLDRFQPGDVMLGDSCFASYFMLALMLNHGVDVVTRQHPCRRTDFRCGQPLGEKDHLALWQRPKRPEWMDEATYATIPETLRVREVYVRVEIRGFRVKDLVIVTTLADAEGYPRAEIARLFRARWHVELDLRSIKVALHLDQLRCKTPQMVRREILVHWLAYNLIRKVMAQAALSQGRLPRSLSFAAAVAVVAGDWNQATLAGQEMLVALTKAQWRLIAWYKVGDRPDRVEPRAIKRRPKEHNLLNKPRQEARAELLHSHGTHS